MKQKKRKLTSQTPPQTPGREVVVLPQMPEMARGKRMVQAYGYLPQPNATPRQDQGGIMKKLLPCPFCASHASFWKGDLGEFLVVCKDLRNCTAQAGPFDSKSKATEVWNRRAGKPGKEK